MASTGLRPNAAVILLFLLLIMLAVEVRVSKSNEDTEALSAFRNQVDAHGQLASNWSGEDACSGQWIGVGCSSGRVTSLSLPNLQLRGTLGPATLSRLFHLRMLDLHGNRLNGTIQLLFSSDSDSQNQQQQFRRLKLLYLSSNDLSGPIPMEGALGQLSRLARLDLSDNNLWGPIPTAASVANLSGSLLTLRLQDNLLTGTLPDLASALPLLQQFNASNNRLYGTLPRAMLQRFGISAFQGNTQLCSSPNCSSSSIHIPSSPSQSSRSRSSSSSVVPSNPSSMPGNSTNGKEIGAVVGGGDGGTKRTRAIVLIALGNAIILLLLLILVLTYCCCCSTHFGAGKDIGKVRVMEEDAQIVDHGGAVAVHRKWTKGSSNIAGDKNSTESENEEGAALEGQSKLVFFQQEDADHNSTSDSGSSTSSRTARRRRRKEFAFGLEELLRASAEMLGKGSLGTVYRAVLEGGSMVAVKRLKDANPCRRRDFHKYMDLIGRLNHPNIVPLKAYYFAKQEKLLIYHYLPNGNLYNLLHGNRGGPGRVPLNWTMRVSLMLGAARGLAHIHEEYTSSRIPHGNIKSANVLVDKNGTACISDFGLALLLNPVHAIARLGGYMAPEQQAAAEGRQLLSQEADVYSFGVVLLELLTGRAPAQHPPPKKNNIGEGLGLTGINLVEWVKSVVTEEWTAQVFDTELMRYRNIQEEMVAMLHVALACVAQQPDARPTMAEVVKMIEDVGVVEQSPLSEEYLDSSRVSLSPSPPTTNMEDGLHSC